MVNMHEDPSISGNWKYSCTNSGCFREFEQDPEEVEEDGLECPYCGSSEASKKIIYHD